MHQEPLGSLPDLWKETYDLVAQVPLGKVTTYGAVAEALGDIVASRFVGLAMSRNDDIVRVPCRRVVQSDAAIGGYTGGGPTKKTRLLRGEGIEIKGNKVQNLEDVLFKDFVSSHPLRKLRKRQLSLRERLSSKSTGEELEKVAGVDISYQGEHGYAAMVVFDSRTGRELERVVMEGDARFPYIPTYLAFRELPLVAPLMNLLDDRTVLMYDGNGILHPDGFGVASHAGVVFDVPSIGVAKKLLCGTIRGQNRVVMNDRVVGYRIGEGSKPVFVSPGHRISSKETLEITKRFLKSRIPEPTRLAHIEANAARREGSHK
jgi:deoxyribonuclease V